jgi:23S rRNA (adenine1618-N6)-methyltransferase
MAESSLDPMTSALRKPVPSDHYDSPIDFRALAQTSEEFSAMLKKNGQLDFSDGASVRALTRALLARDFEIDLVLPEDRLCPPVPNRLNYVRWIKELLDASSDGRQSHSDDSNSDTDTVLGVDIGSGASAIYPLLGLRQNQSWRMVCTELDQKNAQYASENLRRNGLRSRASLVPIGNANEVLTQQTLQALTQLAGEQPRGALEVSFVMTNPPFYSSREEMASGSATKRDPNPNGSSCTGADVEMLCEGGEIAFVKRLITESIRLRNETMSIPDKRTGNAIQTNIQINWWTAMLGKLSSVSTIAEALKSADCTNYTVTEFIQGEKTRRWAVAWSWLGFRPNTTYLLVPKSIERRLHPPSTVTKWTLYDETDESDVWAQIGTELNELVQDVRESGVPPQETPRLKQITPPKDISTSRTAVVVFPCGDCWSRKARRARVRRRSQPNASVHNDSTGRDSKLAFRISVQQQQQQQQTEVDSAAAAASTARSNEMDIDQPRQAQVEVRWLYGHDAVQFESFCGWLRRKLRGGE